MAAISLLMFTLMFNYSLLIAKEIEIPPTNGNDMGNLKTYIVHVKQPKSILSTKSEDLDLHSYYRSFLPTSVASSDKEQSIVYSYQNVITGFAARLTIEEVKAMEEKEGFLSAKPERILSLQTTHSPEFLGLNQRMGVWKGSNFGKGVIIGVLDTGIFPDHPSFSGEGMPPPPRKWKGKCEFDSSKCNNKLIGARSFDIGAQAIKGVKADPPLDDDGHGTHTSSTAAGAFVKNAGALGQAKGTASGMAPYAHLAIYKVCFGPDCPESDILAGLDAAIVDGVDVLSISLGGDAVPFFRTILL